MSFIFRLIATLFPGGYRFLVISLVGFVCAPEVSDFFSKSFFMVSLLAAFSGMAVSSQAYVVGCRLMASGQLLLTFVLLLIAAVPGFSFWSGTLGDYWVVLLAAFCYSFFEIVRSFLASEGRFVPLVVGGFIAIVSLGPVLYLGRDFPQWLPIFVFLSLLLSLLVVNIDVFKGGSWINKKVIRDVASYSLSNGLSSGASFALPLLLVVEFGDGSAISIAQVFTLSALFLFYPRYLSAGFFVDFKKNKNFNLIEKFEKKVIWYVFGVTFVYLLITALFFPLYFKYSIIFISMQASQLALPYSNTFMLMGGGGRLLKVNFISLVFFVGVGVVVYILLAQGEERGIVLLCAYIGFVFLRNYLTKCSCKRWYF